MLKNMPPDLTALVQQAKLAQPTRETALTALRCLDLTSLNDDDTTEKIADLCTRADQGDLGHTAAVCVYPKFVTQAFNAVAGKGINVATVINFPSGKGTPGQTAADTKAAIAAGAKEIDIVFDYESFLKDDGPSARKLLRACREACSENVKMKVILETAEFDEGFSLALSSLTAMTCGADFIKTSTGKDPKGGASLEVAAVMLDAIRFYQKTLGEEKSLKISGGVKSVADAAQYIALAESIMGKDWVKPENFRFGASSLLNDIRRVLDGGGNMPSGPRPAGY